MALINDITDIQDVSFQETVRHDPRLNHDDPLLDCLMVVCKLHGIITSHNVLTAGLPLQSNCLTLGAVPRAAQRAGLKARVIQRPLAKITALSLPAIVVMHNGQAAVLTALEEGKARLMPGRPKAAQLRLISPSLKSSMPVKPFLFSRYMSTTASQRR